MADGEGAAVKVEPQCDRMRAAMPAGSLMGSAVGEEASNAKLPLPPGSIALRTRRVDSFLSWNSYSGREDFRRASSSMRSAVDVRESSSR